MHQPGPPEDLWSAAKRRVLSRPKDPPASTEGSRGTSLRFFAPAQDATLRALCTIVLAHPDDPLAPVPDTVDEKLAAGNDPGEGETWRLVLEGLDHTAERRHQAQDFATCPPPERLAIVGEFVAGRLTGGPWDRLDVTAAWSTVLRGVLAAFHSRPGSCRGATAST
jgi:Gluconate 2-dehydrogenase subunit 3